MKSDLKRYVKEFLNEGKYDQNIYKCVIVLGPAGVGKSTAIKKIVGGTGLKYCNADQILELDIDKELDVINKGESWKDKKNKERVKSGELWDRAKYMDSEDHAETLSKHYRKASKLNDTRLTQYVNNRLGIVLEGTASAEKSYEWYHNNLIKPLHEVGYDILVVGIYAPINVCLQRNTKRGKEGGRSINTTTMESIFYGFIDEYHEIITKATGELYDAITVLNTDFDEVSKKKIMSYVHMTNHPNSIEKSKISTLKKLNVYLNKFIRGLVSSSSDIHPDDLVEQISNFLKSSKEWRTLINRLRILQDKIDHNPKEQFLLKNAIEINQIDKVMRAFLSHSQKQKQDKFDSSKKVNF